jgi:DNA-binding response OmpR family regulator
VDQRKLEMKPQVLLYTRDATFDDLLAEALSGTEALVLSARTVSDALQIVCERGGELAFALLDFDGGCRGMTLLSAMHTCYDQLPILVTTSKDAEHATALAYANGARGCLTKPIRAALLTSAIAGLKETQGELAAA